MGKRNIEFKVNAANGRAVKALDADKSETDMAEIIRNTVAALMKVI